MIGSKDKYALVTGASSGIGYELAKLFAKEGKHLVVVARRIDKLADLKKELENRYGTQVKVLIKDLSKPEAPQEIFYELQKEHIGVDVLVNNAGYGVYGKFSETDLQQELEMIQVNVTSLIGLTKLFVKKMVESESGWILNVGSTGSFVPVPLEAVYGATKSFILSFSEALANELKGTGVSVTCLCPGLTDTGFYRKAVGKEPRANQRRWMMDAAKVAKVGYKALEEGKSFILPGFINRSIPIQVRVIPRPWLLRLSRWVLERGGS